MVVCGIAGCGGDEQPAAIPLPAELRERAAERGAYAEPLGAAVSLEPAGEDPAYLRRLVTEFTSVTPENAMKWEVVHPRPDTYDFTAADAIVDLARRTGKRVRGHTLVWDQQLAGWVTERDWEPAALEDALREHVRRVAGHFRGRVAQWDAVNEVLDPDGSLTPNVFLRVLGERYIDIAFEEAARAAPDAELFLNEVGAERPGPMQDGLVRLVRRLQRRDVPIDGVGLQNHATVTNPQSAEEWRTTFGRFADLGLDVEITEMDVVVPSTTPTSDAVLRRQAAMYRAVGRACRTTDACTGVTVWGVTDRHSWLTPERRPLLFTGSGEAKPAFRALTDALRAGN